MKINPWDIACLFWKQASPSTRFFQIKTTNSFNLQYDNEKKIYKKLFFQDIDSSFSVEWWLINLFQPFEIVVEKNTIGRIQDSGSEVVMFVIDGRS